MGLAVEVMRGRNCGSVPVVDDQNRIVGMITDRDICLHSEKAGKNLVELRVAQGMTSNVECCGPDDSLAEAEKKLQARQIRRLPVVDGKRRLIGILSLADLVRDRRKKKLGQTIASISRPAKRAKNRARSSRKQP
jgi:CBS domain-containing protein